MCKNSYEYFRSVDGNDKAEAPANPVDCMVSLPEPSSVEESSTDNEEMLAQWVTRLEGQIKLLRKIHPVKYKHCCHEWDGLEIDEYDLEFEACTCFTELRAG
jgi:hypothetical protein